MSALIINWSLEVWKPKSFTQACIFNYDFDKVLPKINLLIQRFLKKKSKTIVFN